MSIENWYNKGEGSEHMKRQIAKDNRNQKALVEKPKSTSILTRINDFDFVCKIAKVLNCLPSLFVGDNSHIITAAEKLQTELANMRTYRHDTVRGLVDHRDETIKRQAERIAELEDLLNKASCHLDAVNNALFLNEIEQALKG